MGRLSGLFPVLQEFSGKYEENRLKHDPERAHHSTSAQEKNNFNPQHKVSKLFYPPLKEQISWAAHLSFAASKAR